MQFDTELIISEMEKRPQLYNPAHPEYNDNAKRKILWEEVFEGVVPRWVHMSFGERSQAGREVKRKWCSLRDCFRRELNLIKASSAEGWQNKKRKYVYFDKLFFLEPFTKVGIEETPELPHSPQQYLQQQQLMKAESPEDEAGFEAHLKEPLLGRSYDPDEAFLLSLLPSFQGLDEDGKLLLRVQVMQAVIKFKQEHKRDCLQPGTE